jgi:hypothetical protein
MVPRACRSFWGSHYQRCTSTAQKCTAGASSPTDGSCRSISGRWWVSCDALQRNGLAFGRRPLFLSMLSPPFSCCGRQPPNCTSLEKELYVWLPEYGPESFSACQCGELYPFSFIDGTLGSQDAGLPIFVQHTASGAVGVQVPLLITNHFLIQGRRCHFCVCEVSGCVKACSSSFF